MILGQIQGHDVIYIPERDVVFCKNTAVSFSKLDKAINSNLIIEKIDKLTITKEKDLISLGCLVTSKSNYIKMRSKIYDSKKEHTWR